MHWGFPARPRAAGRQWTSCCNEPAGSIEFTLSPSFFPFCRYRSPRVHWRHSCVHHHVSQSMKSANNAPLDGFRKLGQWFPAQQPAHGPITRCALASRTADSRCAMFITVRPRHIACTYSVELIRSDHNTRALVAFIKNQNSRISSAPSLWQCDWRCPRRQRCSDVSALHRVVASGKLQDDHVALPILAPLYFPRLGVQDSSRCDVFTNYSRANSNVVPCSTYAICLRS